MVGVMLDDRELHLVIREACALSHARVIRHTGVDAGTFHASPKAYNAILNSTFHTQPPPFTSNHRHSHTTTAPKHALNATSTFRTQNHNEARL